MTQENRKFTIVNARLPRDGNKIYYLVQLQEYANRLNAKFVSVQFGKQDIRGGHSITCYYKENTCTGLKYFSSFKELLAFVEGVNAAFDNYGEKYKGVQ